MYSHYEKSRIPFSYVLYAYSVKRAYRGTKPKESFWLHYVQVVCTSYVQVVCTSYVPVEHTSCMYILVVCSCYVLVLYTSCMF